MSRGIIKINFGYSFQRRLLSAHFLSFFPSCFLFFRSDKKYEKNKLNNRSFCSCYFLATRRTTTAIQNNSCIMRQGEEFSTAGEPMSPSCRAFDDETREESVPIIDAKCQSTRGETANLKAERGSCQAENRDACSAATIEREDERLPLHEQRCPDSVCYHWDSKPTNWGDEERLDALTNDRDQEHCSEEREEAPSESDFHDQHEYEQQLLLLDEEEEMMRREWEEADREYEESRTTAILDELQQIHNEEYPEQHRTEETIPETTAENFVEIDEEEENDFLDPLLLPPNDSQMEELVASCDRRDRENPNPVGGATNNNPRASGNLATASSCVVCLSAPRTHAYVPCGHFCVCFSCAKQQTQQPRTLAAASSCPVCQQPCTRIMRIFVP